MKRTILYLFILTATQSCVAQKIKDMKNSKKIDKIYYQKVQENCKNTRWRNKIKSTNTDKKLHM
uniref:hypothetical protein n=1 Tax=Hoylesella saccharolytica TaxID=633701 RepID=UPI0028E5F901